MKFKRILVTGGAGFIGSAFIRYGLRAIPSLERIVNLDVLTYAADLANVAANQVAGHPVPAQTLTDPFTRTAPRPELPTLRALSGGLPNGPESMTGVQYEQPRPNGYRPL